MQALLYSLFTGVFMLIPFVNLAQDQPEFSYELRVTNMKGQPDSGREVVFVETSTFERLAFRTDASGQLSLTFDHGKVWLGSVGDMRNCIEIDVSFGGRGSRTMTYDPKGWERENQVLPDRRSIAFTEVDQTRLTSREKPTNTETVLTIMLQDQNRKSYSRVDVTLVCFETATKYVSKTDAAGKATFKLPINQNYEIDVDGVESLKYIDLGPRAMTQTMGIMYQPRTFTEQKDDRFIVQNVPNGTEPSSSHARVKLKVRKGYDTAIDEDVYVRVLKSNKVYKAKTNDQGEVTFMLPIRAQYAVDFKYQRSADFIDLSKVKGIAFQNMGVNYVVDPRLANIEEFIPGVDELVEYDMHSFVDAQYPEPTTNDVDFQLKWGNKFNENSKEALLEVGMKVKSKMTRKSADPLNICFVVDKSGSMTGEDRIGQLKKSLIKFVEQLSPDDMISIVVFESGATLAVPAKKVKDKKAIIDIIHAIQAGGGTNIYSGMVMGFEEVKKLKTANSINRVVLLTDGYGSTPPEQVIAEAKNHIAGGIELSCVGVGIDYNQELLSLLASAGGGLLHLASTSAGIEEVFQRELESILYPMAKKAQLTVRYNDQIVYRQLYGYANEKVSAGKMNVEIPHLFPGLSQMALIKFDLINPTRAIVNEKVVVTLEYIDAVTNKPVKIEKKIHPEWTDATGELDMAIDREHKKVLAVAIANQSLKQMSNSFESGNNDEAKAALESAIAQLQNLFPDATPSELLAVVDQLQVYVDAFQILKEQSNY
ncbi:MAG: VWA domain-containing protein [Fluviicola sp.]